MTIIDFLKTTKNKYKSSNWPKRPQSLNIEMTAACDARCIHCPREEMERKKVPMNFDLFKKIIDEASEMEIPEICPNGFGELLTIKDLEKYFSYIRSKSHRFKIFINTNANRMFEDKRKIFLDYEVDSLNICLDGATHETMSLVRPKLDPQKIEENILSLIEEREKRGIKKPHVRVGYVVIPQNEHECELFLQKWKGKVDKVGLDGFSNRIDSVSEDLKSAKNQMPFSSSCVLPFNTLNVWADGICVLCCNDWDEEYIVGDSNVQSLNEIWHSDAFQKVREAHQKGCGSSIEICKKCNWWQAPNKGDKLWA